MDDSENLKEMEETEKKMRILKKMEDIRNLKQMEDIENLNNLPTVPFSVLTLQEKEKNGLLKNNLDAINYIFEYYFEIKKREYLFYNVLMDDFEVIKKEDFKNDVIDKLDNDKEIYKIIKKNNKIYNVVCNIGKPRIYKQKDVYYINYSGAFLHQNYKNYDDYDDDTKGKVQRILDMMKEISCNNNEEMFKYYLLWYAQIARGLKTECMITRTSPVQGIGKSMEPKFFLEHVFGLKVSLQYNKLEAILTNFNKIFLGKLFIVLEDIRELTDSEYKKFTGEMKTLVTEDYGAYRDLYEKSIQAKNISNFVCTSNYPIKDTGRRIILLDMNLSKRRDNDYFKLLKKDCFNNKIGEAMFSYLLTKISDKEALEFYGQNDFPDTEKKLIARADSLSTVEKFIKFEYVLCKKSMINLSPNELLEKYKYYCETINKRCCGRNSFYARLEDIGIKRKTSKGYEYYNENSETLIEIANKEKWLCKYDKDFNEDFKGESEDLTITFKENEMNKLKITIDEKNDLLKEKDNLLKEKDEEIEKLKEALLKLELIELMKKSKINNNQERAITFKEKNSPFSSTHAGDCKGQACPYIEDPKEEDDLAL